MAGEKTTPAPQTEVIPGPRREVNAADLTPPNEGLPGQVNPEPDEGGLIQLPPVPTEPLDQPQTFEIDETQEPQPPEPEVTHDPLKDTKAKLTKVEQELADNKKLMQTILFKRELEAMGGQDQFMPPQAPGQATEEYLPDELPQNDPNWPAKYTRRQRETDKLERQQERERDEFERFMRDNSDFPDYMDDMRTLTTRNPGAFQGPKGLGVLYDLAKKERRIRELEGNQAAVRDRAVAAGAQLAKQSAGQPFVSPKAGGGSVSGAMKVPANFHLLSSEDRVKWLKQAGLYREE